MVWIKTMIDVFKKITVDFDFMKLRNDVNHVYHTIKEQAVNTQYEALAYRNICITASKPNSDDWTDGIAGKTYVNKTGAQGKQGVLTSQVGDDSNEMLDETQFVHPIKQIQGLYLEEDKSLGVTASAANDLTYTVTYEELSQEFK